jgi:hypothetical protein
MSRTLEIVKVDALRRLRPFLRQEPSRFRSKARAERDQAIRAYLAEVVQAHLFELIGGQVLDPEMDLKAWLEGVLAEATAGADHHPAVAAAAAEHRDSLFDIVRLGYLAEAERRQRSWEAAGMGGARITPEMLSEEAEAKREWEAEAQRRLAALAGEPEMGRQRLDSRLLVSTNKTDRRAAVDRFIAKVAEAGYKITRKDIWTVAGYKNSTDFERFQRADRRTTETAAANFTRVLRMKPGDFIRALQKRAQK